MRLEGRVAVVTGGARGIGRAYTERFLREGASVQIADVDDAHGTETVDELRELGPVGYAHCDVSDVDSVDAYVAATTERFGRIDILVNNAALFSTLELKPFEKIPAEEWRKVMDVNTLGVFLCCRACAPQMRKGGYGRIVNLASGAPLKGVPHFLHYIASKGAVIAMTRGLARELGADGITVNALAPGFTLSEGVAGIEAHRKVGEATKMTRAIKRDETPQDLVGAVSFLASEDAAFITGQTLVVDGGSAMI
jgi:NAD(P)-dependent dehydrogenase (short-subunit alcohol dehydrogenase family)